MGQRIYVADFPFDTGDRVAVTTCGERDTATIEAMGPDGLMVMWVRLRFECDESVGVYRPEDCEAIDE